VSSKFVVSLSRALHYLYLHCCW